MNFLRSKPPISLSFNERGLDEAQRKRLRTAAGYFQERIDLINSWLRTSREPANFTYDLGRSNKLNIASIIALVTGASYETTHRHITEIDQDAELKNIILARAASDAFMDLHDQTALFGRRIGWYAVARIIKPNMLSKPVSIKALAPWCFARHCVETMPKDLRGATTGPI